MDITEANFRDAARIYADLYDELAAARNMLGDLRRSILEFMQREGIDQLVFADDSKLRRKIERRAGRYGDTMIVEVLRRVR